MSLLPDPDVLLAIADRIGRHATSIRRHAHVLGWSVGHSTWRGTAARTFAVEALEVGAALRRAADGLDRAAGALRRHAARVRAVLADLTRAATDLVQATSAGVHVAGVGVHLGSAAAHTAIDVAGHAAGELVDVVGL